MLILPIVGTGCANEIPLHATQPAPMKSGHQAK